MRSRYWLHTYFKLLLFLVIIISFFTLIWYLIYLSCILILYLLYSQYLCRDAYNFTTFICSFVLHFFLHLSFFLFSGGIFGHQFCSAWWKCIICFPLDTSFTEIIVRTFWWPSGVANNFFIFHEPNNMKQNKNNVQDNWILISFLCHVRD